MAALGCFGDGLLANVAEVGRDFVCKHLLQPEAEQMRCIAAVRTCGDVATSAAGPARTPVAKRTTIGESSADRAICVQIAEAVALVCSLPLQARELALKELTAAANRTKRIALNDKNRRVPCRCVATTGAGFILQGLRYTGFGIVRSLCAIRKLRQSRTAPNPKQDCRAPNS